LPADRPPHRPHLSLSAASVERGPELADVLAVADDLAAVHEPMRVLLSEVGRFGRAGVLWLGPAQNPALSRMQRDTYRALKRAGWPAAFGERSAPRLWVPHCTLATRIPKPQLREVQRTVAEGFAEIYGSIDALATILVGGRGDCGYHPLAQGSQHMPDAR
jgi:2'-5' RNA ligase